MSNTIAKLLASVAAVLALAGLGDIAGIIEFLADNVEVVFTAVTSILAFVTALIANVNGITARGAK